MGRGKIGSNFLGLLDTRAGRVSDAQDQRRRRAHLKSWLKTSDLAFSFFKGYLDLFFDSNIHMKKVC